MTYYNDRSIIHWYYFPFDDNDTLKVYKLLREKMILHLLEKEPDVENVE